MTIQVIFIQAHIKQYVMISRLNCVEDLLLSTTQIARINHTPTEHKQTKFSYTENENDSLDAVITAVYSLKMLL